MIALFDEKNIDENQYVINGTGNASAAGTAKLKIAINQLSKMSSMDTMVANGAVVAGVNNFTNKHSSTNATISMQQQHHQQYHQHHQHSRPQNNQHYPLQFPSSATNHYHEKSHSLHSLDGRPSNENNIYGRVKILPAPNGQPNSQTLQQANLNGNGSSISTTAPFSISQIYGQQNHYHSGSITDSLISSSNESPLTFNHDDPYQDFAADKNSVIRPRPLSSVNNGLKMADKTGQSSTTTILPMLNRNDHSSVSSTKPLTSASGLIEQNGRHLSKTTTTKSTTATVNNGARTFNNNTVHFAVNDDIIAVDNKIENNNNTDDNEPSSMEITVDEINSYGNNANIPLLHVRHGSEPNLIHYFAEDQLNPLDHSTIMKTDNQTQLSINYSNISHHLNNHHNLNNDLEHKRWSTAIAIEQKLPNSQQLMNTSSNNDRSMVRNLFFFNVLVFSL